MPGAHGKGLPRAFPHGDVHGVVADVVVATGSEAGGQGLRLVGGRHVDIVLRGDHGAEQAQMGRNRLREPGVGTGRQNQGSALLLHPAQRRQQRFVVRKP